jgi:hypothetical protein
VQRGLVERFRKHHHFSLKEAGLATGLQTTVTMGEKNETQVHDEVEDHVWHATRYKSPISFRGSWNRTNKW